MGVEEPTIKIKSGVVVRRLKEKSCGDEKPRNQWQDNDSKLDMAKNKGCDVQEDRAQ